MVLFLVRLIGTIFWTIAIYSETGWATASAFIFIYLGFEITGFWMGKVNEWAEKVKFTLSRKL